MESAGAGDAVEVLGIASNSTAPVSSAGRDLIGVARVGKGGSGRLGERGAGGGERARWAATQQTGRGGPRRGGGGGDLRVREGGRGSEGRGCGGRRRREGGGSIGGWMSEEKRRKKMVRTRG